METYLSENFTREEFACKCGCGFDSVSKDLLDALENLRAVVKRPVGVNSGCRCARHNAVVGGADTSQHCLGRAADVIVSGVPPLAVGWIARALGSFSGVKVYRSWCHLDVREGERWYAGF